MSLRLCLIYVQNFFIPDRGSFSSGVTTFSMYFQYAFLIIFWVWCYNKANWNNMKNDITSILDQLLQMFRDPDCNVNTMWEFFKQTLSKSAKQHIPQKNSKDNLPSIFSDEIPTMSLRLCLIYVQNFFIPDRGSLSSGVTTFSMYFQYNKITELRTILQRESPNS
jgi:hypothetical protein